MCRVLESSPGKADMRTTFRDLTCSTQNSLHGRAKEKKSEFRSAGKLIFHIFLFLLVRRAAKKISEVIFRRRYSLGASRHYLIALGLLKRIFSFDPKVACKQNGVIC